MPEREPFRLPVSPDAASLDAAAPDAATPDGAATPDAASMPEAAAMPDAASAPEAAAMPDAASMPDAAAMPGADPLADGAAEMLLATFTRPYIAAILEIRRSLSGRETREVRTPLRKDSLPRAANLHSSR